MLIKESEKSFVTNDNVEIVTTIYRVAHDFRIKHQLHKYESGYIGTHIEVKYEGDRRYVPDIYYNDPWEESEKGYFEIQTIAYGAIKVDDYITYLEDLKYTYGIAKYLQLYFVEGKE